MALPVAVDRANWPSDASLDEAQVLVLGVPTSTLCGPDVEQRTCLRRTPPPPPPPPLVAGGGLCAAHSTPPAAQENPGLPQACWGI